MDKTSVGHRESGLCHCLTTGWLQMSLLLSASGPREPLRSVGLLQVQRNPKSHVIIQCPIALSQELEWRNLVYLLFINLLIQHSLLFILTNHFYTSAEELIKNERPFPGHCIEPPHEVVFLWKWVGDTRNEDENEHVRTGWAVWGQEMMGTSYCHYSYWLYLWLRGKSPDICRAGAAPLAQAGLCWSPLWLNHGHYSLAIESRALIGFWSQ